MSGIIIFGATGGIGSELARRLCRQGADLILAARNEEKLTALSEELDAAACLVDALSGEQVDGGLGTVRGRG